MYYVSKYCKDRIYKRMEKQEAQGPYHSPDQQ